MDKLMIETNRLWIRNLAVADVQDFHLYRSNPEVTKYQGFNVFTLEEVKAVIEEHAKKKFGVTGEWMQQGIENKTTRRLISDCAIKLDKNDTYDCIWMKQFLTQRCS